MTVAFLLTTLVVVATPGTGALYTVATGLAHGIRSAAVAALGCTLGIVPHMLAAVTGLAAVLHGSAVAFQTLKYLGIAFLLYLAWSMWRDDSEFVPVNQPAAPPGTWRIVGTAVAVNLLNPKLTLVFFAFLPQFVAPDEGAAVTQRLRLSAVFMAVTLVVFACYGVFAAAVRDQVTRRPRVVTLLRRTFAVSYVALAARMAAASR